MGDGFLVIPENGTIYSPVEGVVSSIFPTKHAVGIQTTTGLEILLHMGVNTVELEGKPFDIKVSEGQKVTPTTIIAEVDLAAIKQAGKETDMLVIITNMDAVASNVLETTGSAEPNTPVMSVKTV